MSKKLFVGNLPFDVNDADLVKVFTVVGKVVSANVVINHKSGRSKGFAFVEMETEELAKQAVTTFEGATLNERAITVQVAQPKPETPAKERKPKKDRHSRPRPEAPREAPKVVTIGGGATATEIKAESGSESTTEQTTEQKSSSDTQDTLPPA